MTAYAEGGSQRLPGSENFSQDYLDSIKIEKSEKSSAEKISDHNKYLREIAKTDRMLKD